MDLKPLHLKIAKENSEREQLNNVVFKEIDLGGHNSPTIQADLVYCMYVLHHLPNPMVELKKLIQMTKPGGQIVIGEPIGDASWIFPEHAAYNKSLELLRIFFAQKNRHLNYGKELVQELKNFDSVEIIDIEHRSPILHKIETKIHHVMIMGIFKQQLIEEGFIKENDFAKLEKEINEIVNNPKYIINGIGVALIRAKKT